MDNLMLSVIIPVYNAQGVLKAAVDSVLSQGIDDLEIILINDGSKDKSLEVCHELARADSRIQVISQENAGPGAARNAGLERARGKYLAFVDSDDTSVKGSLAGVLERVSGRHADLVISHFNIILNNQVYDRGFIKDDVTMGKEAFYDALARRPGSYYYSALWNKLYSADIVKQHGLRFDPSFSWGEDFDFNMRYYQHVETIIFQSRPVYNYRRTYSGQTWRTMFGLASSIKIKARLYQKLKTLYLRAGLFHRYRPHIYRYVFNVTITT